MSVKNLSNLNKLHEETKLSGNELFEMNNEMNTQTKAHFFIALSYYIYLSVSFLDPFYNVRLIDIAPKLTSINIADHS